MIEMKGNIWDFYKKDPEAYICITTNGFVKTNGECVMGAGVAKEAKEKFRSDGFSQMVGKIIKNSGNNVYMLTEYRIFTFPTKHNWFENSDIELIKKSAKQLVEYINEFKIPRVYLPRPGCGNGKLKWKDVKPAIEPILDDRILIVSKEYVNDKI